jgi:hypothetical protein
MKLDTYGKTSPRTTPQPLAAADDMAYETMSAWNVNDDRIVVYCIGLVTPNVRYVSPNGRDLALGYDKGRHWVRCIKERENVTK